MEAAESDDRGNPDRDVDAQDGADDAGALPRYVLPEAPECRAEGVVLAKERVIAHSLCAPLLAMRGGGPYQSFRREVVGATPGGDLEHRADGLMERVDPVAVGIHVPRLLPTQRFPFGD